MVLAILVLSSFHKILEYACQCLFKKSAGILIGMALTLYIKLEIIDSMTVFSLRSVNTVYLSSVIQVFFVLWFSAYRSCIFCWIYTQVVHVGGTIKSTFRI